MLYQKVTVYSCIYFVCFLSEYLTLLYQFLAQNSRKHLQVHVFTEIMFSIIITLFVQKVSVLKRDFVM